MISDIPKYCRTCCITGYQLTKLDPKNSIKKDFKLMLTRWPMKMAFASQSETAVLDSIMSTTAETKDRDHSLNFMFYFMFHVLIRSLYV